MGTLELKTFAICYIPYNLLSVCPILNTPSSKREYRSCSLPILITVFWVRIFLSVKTLTSKLISLKIRESLENTNKRTIYNQRWSVAPIAVLCFISLLLSGHSDQVLSDGFLWEILVIAIIHRSSNVFAKREKCFRKISRYMI